jgi:hypothetical protein
MAYMTEPTPKSAYSDAEDGGCISPKSWYMPKELHGVTAQKNTTLNIYVIKLTN